MPEDLHIPPLEWIDPLFHYTPLETEDSIRLLLVDGAEEWNAPLRCELIPITLTDVVEQEINFAAISYFWGDVSPRQLRPIHIGSTLMSIGPNLYDAIQCCRLRGSQTLMWADGVCINQKDPQERSQQVALMRTIYSTAQITIAYIGHGGASFTSRSAWNFLQRNSEFTKANFPETYQQLDDAIDFRGNLDDVEDDILDRAWFRRAWVLQEVVVSRRLIIQSGSRWIPWEDFCKITLLSSRVHDRYGLSLSKRDLYSYIRNQFLCRCAFQESRGNAQILPSWYKSVKSEIEHDQSSLDLLAYSRRLQATDQRDKIYALLGISTDLELIDFPVDYNKDYEFVYIDFARYYISNIGSYDILNHVESHSGMPYRSWVPNWLSAPLFSRTILSILPKQNPEKTARRKLHVLSSHSWEPDRHARIQCNGEVIGSITWKAMSIQLNGAVEEIFEKLRHQYRHDEREMNARILSKWEMLGYGTAELKRLEQESREYLMTSSREHVMRDLPEWATWPHYAAYRRASLVEAEEAATAALAAQKAAERDAHDDADNNDDDDVEVEEDKDDVDDDDDGPSLAARVAALSASRELDIGIDDTLRKPFDELGILEQHLLRRSRKTVEFSSDDGSKSVDVIIDRTSIVDQRCFGKFALADLPNEVNVALLPAAAEVGDVIVAIHGARLPFVVREIVEDGEVTEEEYQRLMGGLPSRRHFMFIGECLFDDFEVWDCVGEGEEDGVVEPPYSETFVFH